MKRINIYICIILLAISFLITPAPAAAQNMADYTAYPPFIASTAKPNLLLMIDNSGSMYDLQYIDNGNLPARASSYCYDQTYISTNIYAGYFEKDSIYSYDFTFNRFEEDAFPVSCSHKVSGEVCVNVVAGSPSTVNRFTARGNYLNWMITSKLDMQKQILTGGKYDTAAEVFISESRGCVGRRFLKEALTADYVEGGANTSLGITFAVNGPVNSINPTAPSPGGQTYIQIFLGDYNEAICQEAIQAINDSINPSAIRSNVEDCLSYDPNAAPGSQYCLLDPARTCTMDSECDDIFASGDCTDVNPKKDRTCVAPAVMAGQSCVEDADCSTFTSVGPCVGGTTHSADVNTKIIFNQSMQECWQIWNGKNTEVGHDAWASESFKCEEIYEGYKICDGGDNDGNTCTSDLDCTGGGTCVDGPDAIRSGNPGLICSPAYTGYCATTADDWATTTWVAKEYADPEDCFLSKYLEYCNAVRLPQAIDPSDTPDDTSETANVPAIISDIGVEAQLGAPIAEVKANRYDTDTPTGLLDDFSDSIRFGAMSFDFDGSEYECSLSATDALECPKICSFTTTTVCNSDLDCPGGETCGYTWISDDGGEIIHYIGDAVGDHDTGLIRAIDDIKANTWTPFAEAYYNAIAYFVKDATLNPELDPAKYTASADAIKAPLDPDDFDPNRNPIQFSCQTNNILLISDGASTTDIHSSMKNKVTDGSGFFNDGDAIDPATCGNYYGSTYLDDLSYYARNRNIFDPSDNDPSDNDIAQKIKTYVVYTGADASTETGECAPKTLMENTALNGGTTLYNPEDPEALAAALKTAFETIGGGTASGTAVSVLSTTGEGEGAIYQAYFYPEKLEGSKTRKWIGYVHSLFADNYGNIREDTNNNSALDMDNDLILEMEFSAELGTLVNRFTDSDGDGVKDSATPSSVVSIEEVSSLWRGGDILWQTNPDSRTMYSTTDGTTMTDFSIANYSTFKPYLRVTPTADPADSDEEAKNIIDWIRGYDFTGSVAVNDFKPYVTDAGHPGGYRQRSITGVTSDGSTKTLVWKLGDIIYSTPSVVAKPIENYDMIYHDTSYYNYFKNNVQRRHVVYIGANDGTLHAFNGGFFSNKNHQYCTGTPDSSGNCTSGTYALGEELWAFIPRAILPHLKWLTDPDYTHVYYVDLKPKITDVKIFSAGGGHTDGWGTILIGGYRYGGKDINWTAPDGTPYSASPEYFALDVSDPLNPRLLWTFSHPDLGLSISYPAVAKVGSSWFAVFGSGATDFDVGSNLTSFQSGNIFVLKLSAGSNGVITSWTENSNFWKIPTGNGISFTANPITVDVDMDYNVDVIYMGENYNDGLSWNALMRRITTDNGTESTPGNWDLSTLANVSNISGGKDKSMKITAAPSAAMDDQMNLWTYFGTGQFYGLADKNLTDTGAFYGVKDKCWKGTCSNSYTDFMDVSAATVKTDGTVSGVNTCAGAPGGGTWYDLINSANTCDGWAVYFNDLGENVDFLGNTLNHSGERVFTKPLVVGGLVAFGSYIPGTSVCSYLGESNAYALYYKTGTAFDSYVFKEQKENANPPEDVARVVNLGEGMPSSPSGQRTESGTANIYFQQSTGTIITAEQQTPISIKSALKGWKSEELP